MKKKTSSKFGAFLHSDAAGGVALIIATILALIMANSGLHTGYENFLHMEISIGAGGAIFAKTAHHWINDGLMAIFFFMIGLEIKREMLEGELSSPAKALLPALAAVGGMAVPALIYLAINRDQPMNLHGWAIPSATDIAFALGILALLGKRVPASIKILLMAIAVLDDLGAIIIIALFYTSTLSFYALGIAAACIAVLAAMNKMNVTRTSIYIVIGVIMWAAVLQSGVHATLAGVTTALFIPREKIDAMVKGLHNWVAFAIMPLFAFANAGVSLVGVSLANLAMPIPLGIMAGLFLGKQLGIFLTIFIAVKTGASPMPKGVGWQHIYGMALLCGIGFTMSLFIGGLAFHNPDDMRDVRLGVLAGSLLSSLLGFTILKWGHKK